jgi:osmotically-inducible protein OsmY
MEEQIKKDIFDALYWDNRVNASNINVEVEFTEARLSGTVPSSMARRAAEEDALLVPGIYSVKNDISIQYKIPDVPTDGEIQAMIQNMYLWNTSIDDSKIAVNVNKGIVTLKGTVGSLWELVRAEDLADDIIGVTGVINGLAVVPTESYLDEQIAKRINNAFERSIVIDVDNVTVTVKNGKVTLNGTVSSGFGRNRAREITLLTAGVTSVENLITVK